MNIINKLFLRIRAEIVYAKAKAVADRKAKEYPPLTFFVLPMESGKLIVVDYNQFCEMRRWGKAPKDAKPKDLYKDCVYHTKCMSEKGKASHKRKYLKWKGLL